MKYEDFGDNTLAQIHYAHALPPSEALAFVTKQFDDGSFRKHTRDWFGVLGTLASKPEAAAGVDALRARLVARLLANRIDREAHELTPMLFSSDAQATPGEAQTIFRWLVAVAGPGEASLVADVLQTAVGRRRGFESPALEALVAHLIQVGAGELRSQRRGRLVVDLLDHLATSEGATGLMPPLLRILVNTDRATGGVAWANPALHRIVRRAIDRLAKENPGSQLVIDVVTSFGPRLAEMWTSPMNGEAPALFLAASITRGLLADRFPADVAESAWPACFLNEPPHGIVLANRTSTLAALAALKSHAENPRRNELPGHDERHDRAWTSTIVSEALRMFGTPPADPRIRSLVKQIAARRPAFAEGVGEALVASVSPTSPAAALLREGLTVGRVAAALEMLEPTVSERRAAPAPVDEAALMRSLTAILQAPWDAEIYGVNVPRMLGNAGRVELEALDNDDKVRVAGDVVLLDRTSLFDMFEKLEMGADERVALGAIYFVHELAHVFQGIGDKQRVGELRGAGAETTLMHLDLSADHFASLAVSKAHPRWDLGWLKDLQGRSLVAFPVSPIAASAGRARKAQRLVGLRADWLARKLGILRPEDGYAFADYGPTGGPILVLQSGPPFKVIRSSTLTREHAKALAEAADDGVSGSVAAVDEVLTKVLAQ